MTIGDDRTSGGQAASLATVLAFRPRQPRTDGPARCSAHPAYEAGYCPGCGTAQMIGAARPVQPRDDDEIAEGTGYATAAVDLTMADRQGYEARRVRLERLAPRPYQGTPSEDAWSAGWDRHLAEAVAARQALPDLTRAEVIAEIRTALRKRTGKAWTVKGGRGSGRSWLTITAPPRRCEASGTMTIEDRDELAVALGIEPHMAQQGVLVPGGGYYWHEYLARARGETPTVYGKPSWD